MEKKTVSAIMLALLLTSVLTLAFNIQPVKAGPTTIVVPDDYPTIQEAINAASSGDTISVKEGIYYEHVSVSKRVSLVGENRNSTIIDGNGTGTVVYITADDVSISQLTIRNGSHIPHVTYGIIVHGCNNVIIKENIISKNDFGIFLYHSDNNIVEGNLVFDNWQGVSVTFSDHNYVVNNYMSANEEAGISMGSAATNNMIYDNEINDNGFCGICIGWSTHNEIVKNVLNYNGEAGIRLDSSDNNRIVGNHLALNTRDGIVLFGSNLNTLMKNEIIQNQWDGIALWYSNSNKIYHNNFLENGKQAGSYSGSINTWDDNYPSGGNYWSDYTGVDVKNGPSQNLPGSDGIGDTPYIIDADNTDRYPLMNPCGAPPPPTYALTITAMVGGTTNPTSGAYSYSADSSVQVTAIPNANYLFDYWELDGVNVGSANPYSVLMDKNHALKAVFSLIPPPLSASISPLSASILAGQSVTFTSTVSGGYPPYNYQWCLNGNPVSGATSASWTFTPTTSGIYYVHLKVTDAKANTTQSQTARITVATVPVGGYSFPIQVTTKAEPVLPYYIALVATLTAIFTKLRPKTKRKH